MLGIYEMTRVEWLRLHEGVLARYGLRPSQFESWKTRRSAGL